jgi:hypothetical protein
MRTEPPPTPAVHRVKGALHDRARRGRWAPGSPRTGDKHKEKLSRERLARSGRNGVVIAQREADRTEWNRVCPILPHQTVACATSPSPTARPPAALFNPQSQSDSIDSKLSIRLNVLPTRCTALPQVRRPRADGRPASAPHLHAAPRRVPARGRGTRAGRAARVRGPRWVGVGGPCQEVPGGGRAARAVRVPARGRGSCAGRAAPIRGPRLHLRLHGLCVCVCGG